MWCHKPKVKDNENPPPQKNKKKKKWKPYDVQSIMYMKTLNSKFWSNVSNSPQYARLSLDTLTKQFKGLMSCNVHVKNGFQACYVL